MNPGRNSARNGTRSCSWLMFYVLALALCVCLVLLACFYGHNHTGIYCSAVLGYSVSASLVWGALMCCHTFYNSKIPGQNPSITLRPSCSQYSIIIVHVVTIATLIYCLAINVISSF